MNIICFLSSQFDELYYEFYKKIARKYLHEYIVVVVIDKYVIDEDNERKIVPIITIDSMECIKNGFYDTVTYFPNDACSRDKALYFFSKKYIGYENIWFIEDDVFLPTINTINQIDKKYKSGDLLCNFCHFKPEQQDDWIHWDKITHENLPWCKAMVCAMRMSREMMKTIEEYADSHKKLLFCEILYTTLATQKLLKIIFPNELSTILYRKEWKKDEIDINNLYHPIKGSKEQKIMREDIFFSEGNKFS
jgi:hypothetical protein